MKLIAGIKLILVLLIILSLNAVQNETPVVYSYDTTPKAYAEGCLTFKNWMRASNDQQKILISQYLPLLETDSLAKITMTNQTWAKEIIADISLEDLLSYINKSLMYSKQEPSASEGRIEAIVFKFVRNRLEKDKNYHDLLKVASRVNDEKNQETRRAAGHSKYDLPEFRGRYNNVFVSPYVWFSYDWWKCQNENEKKALVSGYMVSLNEEIKRDWCYNEEEKQRYDLFCKLVSVDDLVKYVDRLFKNPLYRDDDAAYMIYEYMIDNFQIFIEDPIALQG